MEEYRSNSHKSRESDGEPIAEKKIGPVISGTAVTQKKTGFQRFADGLIATSMEDLGSFILGDVIIPAFKKAIMDVVTSGFDMLLYGKASSSRPGPSVSRVSYGGSSYYNYSKSSEPVRATPSSSVFDYDNIIFENRGDAEVVLTARDDIIDRYGVVSVGDLYDLADISTSNYTVNKYGWTNIRSAEVVRCREGYMLKMPRAIPIN